MKLKSLGLKFLTNKWVLNIVSLLALLSIISYLMTKNYMRAFYFVLLSLLIFNFSKNMILVLGVPLVLINLFVSIGMVKEGLENNTTVASEKPEEPTKTPQQKTPPKPEKRTPQGLPRTKIDSDTALDSTTGHPAVTDESFEVGRAKKGGGYDIDYASTVEDAYDELNKIIGGDGIKKLTSDTQSLMKQQLQLADAMKSMGPLIKGMAPLMQQAQGLLSGMGDKENGLGSVMEMAKKFSGAQAQ
jgi:hypothetical protein